MTGRRPVTERGGKSGCRLHARVRKVPVLVVGLTGEGGEFGRRALADEGQNERRRAPIVSGPGWTDK